MLGEPGADGLDGGDLTRLVELPQPAEAPQLAFQVAGRLAEVLEPGRAPVDGVDLHERVDQLLADAATFVGRVQRRAARSRQSPRPRSAPSRRTAHRSWRGPRTRRARRAHVPACSAALAADAPRAARRARSAAAVGAAGGAARPRRRRARSGRSRSNGPRRSGSRAPPPRPGRGRRGRRAAARGQQRRATVTLRLRRGLDDVVRCDRRAHRRESYHRPQPSLRRGVSSDHAQNPHASHLNARLRARRGLAGAAEALASRTQITYFEASAELLNANTRQHAIEQLQYLGVKALRVELNWYDVAPVPDQCDQAQLRR